MTDRTAERRQHRRVPADFPLQGTPEDGGVVARMVASNLSLGGLLCTSTARFPEMTRLAVRLLLPSRRGGKETVSLDIEAVVVRSELCPPSSSGERRYALSLFFTNLDDSAKRHLAKFIGE